ncbi:IS4 family transposase, partial [Candidatus Desantisbacteria bacterium]|nr:IS4 family transposase [Candidatus Desantisbacteria bacterium]
GAAISRDGSFQSAWQNVGETGQSDSLSKARKRLPLKIWEKLHEWINKQIEEEFKEKSLWRGHRVIGVDGSCVSMEDEKELVEEFGRSSSKENDSRFPTARMVFGFTLNTMTVIGHRVGSYKTGENKLFSSLMLSFSAGDLIIGDRCYAGAKLYVGYIKAGLEFITRAHQRLKVELLKIVEVLGENDIIVELPIQIVYRRKDPSLPEVVSVRAIKTEATIRGKKESFWLITSLLDAKKYPKQEIILLYKKRWKVEGLIEEIKIWLSADILRSKTKGGIYKELYARVIAFNLIHWLILKAAKKHQKDPERISVSATLRLTASYSLKIVQGFHIDQGEMSHD